MPKKISVAMLLIVTFTVLLFDTKCSAADMKGSVNSQLKLFVNNQDSWFVDEEEAEPGDYYFYAVTDMNKDKRLELVQLIYLANIDRTRCRFFEVSIMGENLRPANREIIVEGVETEEQKKRLSELGCEIYQGYLYSKALPFNEFLEFWRENVRKNRKKS